MFLFQIHPITSSDKTEVRTQNAITEIIAAEKLGVIKNKKKNEDLQLYQQTFAACCLGLAAQPEPLYEAHC